MAYLMIIGVSVPGGQDGFAQGGPGGAGVQVGQGRQGGGDPGDAVERELGERPVPFGDQIQEPGRLGRLPRVRRGRRPAAGGDRALGQDPGAERGQGGGGGQGQAEQPQDQAAEDGQRGGRLAREVLVAGADDADQGVAGQGVSDRGQGPDGEVAPAGFGGDGVHEDAGADGGQVEDAGAEGAAAVQGEGDAEAGEDQGGGVGDGGFEGGDGGEVAGGIDHAVLEAVKLTAAAVAQLPTGWLVVTVRGEPAGDVGATRASGAAAEVGTASILAVPEEYAVPASWVQSLRVFSAKSARISAPGTIR
jgi:hypothetical protein